MEGSSGRSMVKTFLMIEVDPVDRDVLRFCDSRILMLNYLK